MTESVTETEFGLFPNDTSTSPFGPSAVTMEPAFYQKTKLLPPNLTFFKDDGADLTQTPLTTPLTTPAKPKMNSTNNFFSDEKINFNNIDEKINFNNSLPTPNNTQSFQPQPHNHRTPNRSSNNLQSPNLSSPNLHSPNLENFVQSTKNLQNGFHPNSNFRNKNFKDYDNVNPHNPQTTALPSSIQNTPVNTGRSFHFSNDNPNSPTYSPNNSHMTFHLDFQNFQPFKAVRQFCNEIFIGNLPKNLTRDEIYKQLRNYDLGNGLHLYIKQFKQPRCTARRDSKGCLVLNVGYAFIVTKTQEMAEKLISLKYIKLKQLDGTLVKAEISPIDSYKRDKGHKDWEKSQSGTELEGELDAGIDSGMGVTDGILSQNAAFGDDVLRTNFELCSINEARENQNQPLDVQGPPIQSVFDSIPRL